MKKESVRHLSVGIIFQPTMPPHSKTLEEEGAMIVAFKLVGDGKHLGIRLLQELVHEYGLKTVELYMHFLRTSNQSAAQQVCVVSADI
jgi:N-methylhydantoinase B/oxoprolinase/acetone carboxylase alpha subunit